MPTTTNRAWPYPAFEENPYYTTIVSTFEAQDTDVQTLFTAKPWTASLIADSATLTTPTTETAFNKTVVIPAGALHVVGAMLEFTAAGIYTSGATTSVTLWAKAVLNPAGAAVMYSETIVPVSLENYGWSLMGSATTRSLGTTGIVAGSAGSLGLHPTAMIAGWPDALPTVNTTIAQTLTVTMQISGAMSPSFVILLRSLHVRVMYPTLTVS